MHYGTPKQEILSFQEKTLGNIQEENKAKSELSSEGYQTCIFNLLFLVSTKVSKILRGEVLDEELFRSYFIKLYRKIVQMEV